MPNDKFVSEFRDGNAGRFSELRININVSRCYMSVCVNLVGGNARRFSELKININFNRCYMSVWLNLVGGNVRRFSELMIKVAGAT